MGGVFDSKNETETIYESYNTAKRWGNPSAICMFQIHLNKNYAVNGKLDSCIAFFKNLVILPKK